jgi:hypothetical protein
LIARRYLPTLVFLTDLDQQALLAAHADRAFLMQFALGAVRDAEPS